MGAVEEPFESLLIADISQVKNRFQQKQLSAVLKVRLLFEFLSRASELQHL